MLSIDNSNMSPPITHTVSGMIVSSVCGDNVTEGCAINDASDVMPVESQYNLILQEASNIITIFITVIYLPLCFLISFTNIVNMVVFYKLGLKERVNMCLFSLSLLDILYIAGIYGIDASAPYLFATGKLDTIGPSVTFFFNSHLIGFQSLVLASQVVSAVVALERCLCVTRPLLVKNLLSTKKTAVLLWVFLLVVIFGGFVTDGFRLEVISVFNVEDNSTTFQYFPTQFYLQNKELVDIFGGLVLGTFIPVLCTTCVTVCTIIIGVQLRKRSLWRETVTSASGSFSSRDLSVTRMIVGTSILFIVCILPTVTVWVCINLVPGLAPGGRYEIEYILLVRVFYSATATNSSVNFFVYYAYGSRFRKTVNQLFLSCVCSNNKSDHGYRSENTQ